MSSQDHSLPDSQEEKKPPSSSKSLPQKGSFFMPPDNLSLYPDLPQVNLTPKQRRYFQNGNSSLLESLQVQVVSSLSECRLLWDQFSPNSSLFDTWDFRFAFLSAYQRQPYFVLLKNNAENLALLPLQFEAEKNLYTWFGSTWQEENKFFTKNPLFIPLLLAIAPSPLLLNAISVDLSVWLEKVIKFKADDPKYILRLDGLGSAEDYLKTLKKKKRYNLRKDRRLIESQSPRIIIDRFADFDALINLSIKRFLEKGEDTDWEDPRRIETFRQVIKLGQAEQSYQVRMLSVVINKQIASVDLVVTFNGCYYPLKCGYDVHNFPGIGNYVNLLEIDDAASLGMKKMDFLEIGYGWKDKWFESVPLLQYENK